MKFLSFYHAIGITRSFLVVYMLLFSTLLYAQKAKYEPVYLKDKNSKLQADAQRLTNEGWIEFKKEAKLQADNCALGGVLTVNFLFRM